MLRGYQLKKLQVGEAVALDRKLRSELGWKDQIALTYVADGDRLLVYPPHSDRPLGAVGRCGRRSIHIPRTLLAQLGWRVGDVLFLEVEQEGQLSILSIRRIELEAAIKEAGANG